MKNVVELITSGCFSNSHDEVDVFQGWFVCVTIRVIGANACSTRRRICGMSSDWKCKR